MKRTHRSIWNMPHAEFFAYAQSRLTTITDELKYYDIVLSKDEQLKLIDEIRELLLESEQRVVANEGNLELLEDDGNFEL